MKYFYFFLLIFAMLVFPCLFDMEKLGVCLLDIVLMGASFKMCRKKFPELFV